VSGQGRPLRSLSPGTSKILRLLKFARPESTFRLSRPILGRDVLLAVAAICDHIALRYQPGVEILAAGGAGADQAAIPVGVAPDAAHRFKPDLVHQRKGGFPAAAIGDVIAAAPLI
jgi:hypothetical protein